MPESLIQSKYLKPFSSSDLNKINNLRTLCNSKIIWFLCLISMPPRKFNTKSPQEEQSILSYQSAELNWRWWWVGQTPFFLPKKGMIYRGQGNVICILNQGLYKDIRSCGRSAGSTRLVGVFDFPILKFEECKFATGVAFATRVAFLVTGWYTQPKR